MARPGSSPSDGKRLRIVFVITSLTDGGAQAVLLALLERWRHRCDAHVIALRKGGLYVERLAALGVSVHFLDVEGAASALRGAVLLARWVRRLQPDLVHTWLYHADLLGGVVTRVASSAPVVWGIHHAELSPSLNKAATLRIVRACARLSSRIPVRIVSCSRVAAENHIRAGYRAERFEIIPNGFDVDRLRPDERARTDVRAALGIPADAPLLGIAGRFDPLKDHVGFVRAMEHVARTYPNAHFLMAGKGLDEQNALLVDTAVRAGIRDRLHLLGPRTDLPRVLASLDLFVLSSLGEAFPMVLGEAMACGVACVTTDVGDAAEIVGDTGRVVPKGDPGALARACNELLAMSASSRRALGALARARIVDRFALDGIADRYFALYESLIAR